MKRILDIEAYTAKYLPKTDCVRVISLHLFFMCPIKFLLFLFKKIQAFDALIILINTINLMFYFVFTL